MLRWRLIRLLRVRGVTSAPGHAREIFVGPAGSGTDNSSCGDSGTPCRTPAYATNSRMSACDTVTIRAGTYTTNAVNLSPPSGTGESCRSLVRGDPAASRSSIVLKESDQGTAGGAQFLLLNNGRHHITFQHLTMDGANPSVSDPSQDWNNFWMAFGIWDGDDHASHHLTFDDTEIRYTRNSGYLGSGDSNRITN